MHPGSTRHLGVSAWGMAPLVWVAFADLVCIACLVGQFVWVDYTTGGLAFPLTHHQELNVWLLGVLGGACLAWMLLEARGRTSASTGAGFALASYGLVVRVVWEFSVALFGPAWQVWRAGTTFHDAVALARTAGLAAYAMGLAFVSASLVRERVARRRAPRWAAPLF
jgi:hypothetical protein